jgi:CO/xanthine dehydrogenase FAD-binding subunit
VTYCDPIRLKQALALLGKTPMMVVAGGTDVFAALKPGAAPESILDVTRIAGLRGITKDQGGWRIGATTRWSDIIRADLPACFDGLAQAAREVGSLQIQNAGTLAGNLCNASPAADGVPPLLTLGAQVEIRSAAAQRRLPLSEFVTGVRRVALRDGELVTAIHIPRQPAHAVSAFEKLGGRRYLVISIAMCAVVIGCDDTGRIDHARIAVGACSPVAMRLRALEADTLGRHPEDIAVRPEHLAPLSPIGDMRGSAEYRLDVVAEQIRRAIRRAVQDG